jgi:hypothetical protein
MRRTSISAIIFTCLTVSAPALLGAQTTDLDILKYDLSLRLNLEKRGVFAPLNTLSATARITFANTRESSVNRVPVVLYRLLRVEAVRTGDGRPLNFSQRLTGLENWEMYQANAVTVNLNSSLSPGDTLTLEIDYAGGMVGVQESEMLYVQESLDPDFTIIRAETSSYPHLAEPTRKGLRERLAGGDSFDQVLEVAVPEGLVVASGLELTSKNTVDGWTTWAFRSREPSFQILLPVAPYEVIEVGPSRVYHFPEDRAGAQRVSQGITDAMALYKSWFGALRDQSSFAVVEIPEWHGSQALRPTVIQEATAFRDASAMAELYHEVSHFWNVADPSLTPSRWNEGLAMYLQELTQQVLQGDTAGLERAWDRDRQALARELDEHPEYRDVPLIQAGEKGLTSVLSYRGGGLMFALLHHRLGQERLLSELREFYQSYFKSGATSKEFADFIVARAPDARRIVDEWFLGSTYSKLLLDGLDFAALVKRYEPD